MYTKCHWKHQTRFIPLNICLLIAAHVFFGCTLEEPSYGEYIKDGEYILCPGVTAIYFEDGSSVTADNPTYDNKDYYAAFQFGMCPAVSPTCVETANGHICTRPCALGQEYCFNTCVNYDVTNIASCDSSDGQTITCKEGYQDCDGEIQNGCEYDLETNHAVSCVKNGDDYTVTCREDYSDCDGNHKNGCEYQLSPNHAIACRNKSVAGYCQSGYGDCNNSYMDGCEINLSNSLEHCGKCSNACPSGQICNGAGVCSDSCAAGSVYCGTTCVEISVNHIDGSQIDGTNRCAILDDGNVYVPCVVDYANCDDNPQNGCEFKLSTLNALFCEHQSLVCRDGFADCDGNYLTGCEYNLIPNHALACMRTEAEDGSIRVTLECAQDYADCDGDYLNGCEYQLSTHNATQCERKTDETTNETYVELTCTNNMADCDGNYLNGCEYDMYLNHVMSCVYNIEYCSGEDVDCDDETGTAIKKRGEITCASSFADIDKDYQNGCEIDGKSNLDHCGALGDASSDDKDSPNYKGEACDSGYLCNNGTCGTTCTAPLQNCGGICIDFAANHIKACSPETTSLGNDNCEAGWTDCDGQLNNGCEYNLSAHHATACTNQTVTCASGYANCDNNYINGCETYIWGSDVANCGSCGNNCTSKDNVLYATCHTGQCQATECDPGWHLSATTVGNTCIQNTPTACAAPNAVTTANCNNISNASAGICNPNGTCSATQCKAGYYLTDGSCVACPAGTYKTTSDGFGISSCTPCPAGKYSAQPAQTSASACLVCDKGKYAPLAGSETCQLCPANTYAPATGSSFCRTCGNFQSSTPGAAICTTNTVGTTCDSHNYIQVRARDTSSTISAYCINDIGDMQDVDYGIDREGRFPDDNRDNAYILMGDIDFGDVDGWKNVAGNSFDGTFIGNNHAIRGNFICHSDCAFMNTLSGATIDSLNLNIDYTATSGNVAVLAFNAKNSVITNVHVTGNISSDEGGASGLVYYSSNNTTIQYSSFSGSVSAPNGDAAGIVAQSEKGNVIGSVVDADIQGYDDVGGIAGSSNSGRIIQCHVRGTISGGRCTGGIVGDALYGTGEDVVSSYVVADIYAEGTAGGIAGNSHYASILSSYFVGEIYGDIVGGILGTDDSGYTDIIQCGVFGEIYGNAPSSSVLAGIIGETVSNQPTKIQSSFNAADLDTAAVAAQICTARNSTVQIGEVYSVGGFSNVDETSDDVYANDGELTAGICASWHRDGKYSTVNTGAVILENNILMYEGHPLLDDLNAYSDHTYDEERWHHRTCRITSDLTDGRPALVTMPIPKTLPDIEFCR